jgi:protein TonB
MNHPATLPPDGALLARRGMPRLGAAVVPGVAPSELGLVQWVGLVMAVLALHGVAAWVVWHGQASQHVELAPPPIEVSLITSEPVATPTQPTPVAPASPAPRRPATPSAAVPPLAARPLPERAVVTSTRPAAQPDMPAPTVAPELNRVANAGAPVNQTVQSAQPTAPVATAASPAPVPDTVRPASPPRAVSGSAVRYLLAPVLQYPRVSRDLGESGSVRLRVLVDEQGRPKEVEILKSCGFPRLDQQAVLAMKAARFQPLIEDGVPRAAWVTPGPLVFNLEEQ